MGKNRAVLVCDKVTMEVKHRFVNCWQAEFFLGINRKSVYSACSTRSVSRDYVLRFEDDYDPNESFEGKHSRPVLVTRNGEVRFFNNQDEAAMGIGYSSSMVRKMLETGAECADGWKARYAR